MSNVKILLAGEDAALRRRMRDALTEGRDYLDFREADGAEPCRRLSESFDCVVISSQVLLALSGGRADHPRQFAGAAVVVLSNSVPTGQDGAALRSDCVAFFPPDRVAEGDSLWRCVEDVLGRRYRRAGRRNRREAAGRTDGLTGLGSAHSLDRLLAEGGQAPSSAPGGACVAVDVDGFRQVNADHGRQMGDAVMRGVAQVVRRLLPSDGQAFRREGGGVLAVLAGCDLARAWGWAQRVRSQVSRHGFQAGARPFTVTVCAGVACSSRELTGGTVAFAEGALALAKRTGRNRCATDAMAAVDRALDRACADAKGDVLARRQRLLAGCAEFLGETQTQHLTVHCQAVADVSGVLAERMGLGSPGARRARTAGLFHDLGKCVLPDALLAQAEPLTADQWALIRGHAEYGADLSLRLGMDEDTASWIRQHHRMAKGSSAPVGAKLLAVADAWSAMTTHRPYSRAMTPQQALAELRRCSGTQFDPPAVEAACATLAAGQPVSRAA